MSTAEELREHVRLLIQPCTTLCQSGSASAKTTREALDLRQSYVKVVMEGNEEETRGNTETYRARVAVAVGAIERPAELLAHERGRGPGHTFGSSFELSCACGPRSRRHADHDAWPATPRQAEQSSCGPVGVRVEE